VSRADIHSSIQQERHHAVFEENSRVSQIVLPEGRLMVDPLALVAKKIDVHDGDYRGDP